MRLLQLVSALLLTACAAHHSVEPDGGSPPSDAVPAADSTAAWDAPPALDAACVPATSASVSFDPGVPMGAGEIAFAGVDADAAVDGVRIHLLGCGGSCPFDLVVGGVGDGLASLRGGDQMIAGTLETDGATYAALSVVDARRCGGCGGTLDLLVGRLASGLQPALTIASAARDCSTGCGEVRAISITALDTTITASQGLPDVIAPPLRAHVTSGYVSPCVICDCALPDVPATGAVVAATGIFAP